MRLSTHEFANQQDARRQRAAGLVPAVLALSLVACLLTSGCQERSLPADTHTPALNTTSSANGSAATAQSQPLRNVTFDTIKFNIKKDEPFRHEMLTPAVEKLDGARVRIRGYILPPPQQTGLTRFVLVRDNMQCCFGPGAALYDSMIVDMHPGTSTDYKVQPIMVEGTFNVREVRTPDGRCVAIYHLTADRAE